MQIEVLESAVEFVEQKMLQPLVLSSGAIAELTEAIATIRVRVGGREATGRGSIYLSDLWAWPDPSRSHATRDAALRRLSREIADNLPASCGEPAHPLEIGLRLHDRFCHSQSSEIPILARAMCLSPFDAALHDGVGIALNRSAFSLYDEPVAIPSADKYFETGAAVAIRKLLRKRPATELAAWYLVGKNDNLEKQVRPWVVDRGYRCLKIKILGRDADEDANRTAEVYRAAREWHVHPIISVDSNEGHTDVDSVLKYLHRLRSLDSEAFAALAYLEQPTGRDILKHRYNWAQVTALKPVLLDEGLTSLDLLDEAKRQGWGGLALKTCKGQSFALTAAAWANENQMTLSMQDLTNAGYAAIHAALFAAFVPTCNGVELNSPQFTPAANEPWLPRLKGLFDPRQGVHEVPRPIPAGLGSLL